MEKLLIVDGHSLLWQMFCGMPSRIINEEGRAIQGTMGFIGAFIKIVKITAPTHIIIIFDGEHENDRVELLPDYKANRPDISDMDEDNPFTHQYDDVRAALNFMSVKHHEVTELVEADDVISSYALKYCGDMEIVISSWDSDFFQLINENVSVLRYRGIKTVICDKEYIKEKYNVYPNQYADYKSLTGDNSDNIKGAEKVGIKTAAALISQFGNLQEIIKNADSIKKPSIRDSILRNIERLQLNYKLIKLNDRATIPLNFTELAYIYNGITTREVLKGVKLLK